jgi:GT2 family glycosyltransferase
VSHRIRVPRADSPRVSILVPSAADPRFLLGCLRSLERHLSASIPSETIVVLDGAPAGGSSRIAENVEGIRILESSVRLGLARSGNRGRRADRGELLILLHDDAEIEPGWLEALVGAADSHPEAGVIGGIVLNPDGSLQGAGAILWRDGFNSPAWIGPPPSPENFGRARAVDFSGSCSLLVRAVTWDAASGLDARLFPAYFVDVDLCMAARSAGWTVLLEPAARIRHHRGASLQPRLRDVAFVRNRERFLEKWGGALEAYEPRADDDAAIARALERTETLAARIAACPKPLRDDEPPSNAEPPDLEERHALEQDLALQKEYARSLEAALEAMQGQLWWRTYRRLLPLIRLLR